MAVFQYQRGLPTGMPQDDVDVRLVDCVLHFEHLRGLLHHRHGQRQSWSYDLPLAYIADVEVDAEARQLVIAAQIGGATQDVVLHGKPAQLRQLRQMVLQGCARSEERES